MSGGYWNQIRIAALGAAVMITSGCADIKYAYDIPEDQGECPANTIYRSGGTGIRDRSGGTGIRDRDGNDVTEYCEMQECPNGGGTPTGEPFMVWHLDDHGVVLGIGLCP